jgi:hypothetical protein
MTYAGRMKSLGFLAGVLFASSAGAIMALTYPAQLTDRERAHVELAACIGPYGIGADEIKSWTYRRRGRADHAEVRCLTHAHADGKPVRYFVQCSQEKSAWKCGAGRLEIVAPVEGGDVIVRFSDLAPAMAVGTVVKLSKEGWLREQPTHPLPEVCEISTGTAPELLTVDCDGWQITASTWCPQGECPRVIATSRVML